MAGGEVLLPMVLNAGAYPSGGVAWSAMPTTLAGGGITQRRAGYFAADMARCCAARTWARRRKRGPKIGFAGRWWTVATPQQAGTLTWAAYGHSWFFDPQAQLSVVILTTPRLRACGRYPQQIRDAVYAA